MLRASAQELTADESLGPDDSEAQVVRVLEGEDEAFLRGAYQLVLGRGIDSDGLAFYAQRLATGTPRSDVLWELSRSDEGVAHLGSQPLLVEAISRLTGRPALGAPATVEELLKLSDAAFVDACLRVMPSTHSPTVMRSMLMARLAGAVPRYQVLIDLAHASGRKAFPHVAGLDGFLERARGDLFPRAESPAELFSYHDAAFIDCAYKTLMGRPPDSMGGGFYLGRLRGGFSRTSIVAGLARSAEGRARRQKLPGLRALVWRYRFANVPGLADLLAPLLRTESDSLAARARRTMQTLAVRISALEAAALSATPHSASGTRQTDAAAPAAALMNGALLEIQRDNFEREMDALRRVVVGLLRRRGETNTQRPGTRRVRRRP